ACALFAALPGKALADSVAGRAAPAAPAPTPNELDARRLLDEAKARLLGLRSLVADYEGTSSPSQNFDRNGMVTFERPNKFAIDQVVGMTAQRDQMVAVCDGAKVTRMDERDFIGYEKPVREGAFFLGQNFLVQFFFDSKPIRFDPTDALWGRSVSLFDRNF